MLSLIRQHNGSTWKSEFKVARGRRHLNLHTNSATLLLAGWRTRWTLRTSRHRPTDLPAWWRRRPHTWKHKQRGAFAYDLCAKGNARRRICRTVAWVDRARENLNKSFFFVVENYKGTYSTLHTYGHTQEHAHTHCTYIYKQWTQLSGLEKGMWRVLNI